MAVNSCPCFNMFLTACIIHRKCHELPMMIMMMMMMVMLIIMFIIIAIISITITVTNQFMWNFEVSLLHNPQHNIRLTQKSLFDGKMHGSTQKSPVRHKNAQFDAKMPYPACIGGHYHYQTSSPFLLKLFSNFNQTFFLKNPHIN